MRHLLFATAVALILAAGPAFAAKNPPLSTQADPSAFPAAKAKIEKELQDGKTYSELTRTQKDEVLAALERIEATLSSGTPVKDMADKDKVALVNDQEFVNTVLTRAREDSRLVCTQERKTGSHRLTPRCRTVAELKRDRELNQEQLRRVQKSHMRAPAGS